MTLAEVLPATRLLSATEELNLIWLLSEDLDMADDISPLEPFKVYDQPTPHETFEARAVLMKALKQSDKSQP
jgi:hypothetical protein